MESTVATDLAQVQARIAAACARAGREATSVRLVAVSKRKPLELIREAYAAGQRDFGENYAQELCRKAEALADLPELRWHFIGPLQRNKAKLLVGRTTLLHSVTSAGQLDALEARAASGDVTLDLLLQLSLAGEAQKAGIVPDDAAALLERCERAPHLRCRGLMTMPPDVTDPAEVAPLFAELARCRDRLGGAGRLPELSMGMSHDFEVAIEQGATLVRVGSAIFGARQ